VVKRGKILIVANTSWFIQNFELKLMQELQAEMEVVAVSPQDDWSAKFPSLGVRFVEIPIRRRGMNPITDVGMIRRLYSIYKRERPDCVFHNTIKPVIYGSIAAKYAAVPRILNMVPGLGYVFTGDRFLQRTLRRLVKQMYKRALAGSHQVFFQNPDDRNFFVENGLVQPDKADLTYGLGVDLDRFQYVSPANNGSDCTFMLVSRVLWDKGVGEFVAAATKVKSAHPGARFQILGKLDQDNPSHIPAETVQEWVRSGAIEYLGEVPDVRPLLEKADVVVLPSYREGIPNALLEGMALGRPVITTDVPGCRETVLDQVTGLLVPPRDSDALATAMDYMIANPGRRAEMGREGRQLAERRFDVKIVNSIILNAVTRP
jgi:glycosyltransferase involved in cell wall biosynthesis